MSSQSPAARRVVLLASIAILVGASLAIAGPLNPPAGPVTNSYKTLTEVEPRTAINATNTPGDANSLFKITQPGSYYLTGNITGVVGKHGIEIAASGVTLDLMGFDLVGVPAMGVFDGVSATALGLTNIAVINGSVRNWGHDGIDLRTFGAINCRVESVVASGNAGACILAAGSSAIVRGCIAASNGSHGISVGPGGVIDSCEVRLNTGAGIDASISCTIKNCSTSGNTGTGIFASSGSTVADCTLQFNTLNGIAIGSSCVVRGNTCSSNGNGNGDGAGIHATGNDNRIEDNNCTSADRGIDVDAAGNIIIRNTCSSNTNNWDVVAGNVILVVNAATAGAVTGNSGGTAPGSTDPHANFTY